MIERVNGKVRERIRGCTKIEKILLFIYNCVFSTFKKNYFQVSNML